MSPTTVKASVEDLKRELWLRMREQETLVWATAQGKEIPIKKMSMNHLINALIYFQTKESIEDIGEMDPMDLWGQD